MLRATVSYAQFGGLGKIKDSLSKTQKKANEIKDTLDKGRDAKKVVDKVKEMRGSFSKSDIDKLFDDVSLVAAAYNQCSDFTISKGKSTVTITGATDNLKGLRKDLPKSDSLRSNTIIEVEKDMCDFVVSIRRIQDPKDKKTPVLIGPGRQQVVDADEKKPVRLRFDFDEQAEVAQLYYIEWLPEPFVVSFLDLKDSDSRKSYFSSDEIPLAKGGKYYDLKNPDGPISLYGYGPRMMVLVESEKALELSDASPQKWMTSLKKAKLVNDVAVSVSWLELFTE